MGMNESKLKKKNRNIVQIFQWGHMFPLEQVPNEQEVNIKSPYRDIEGKKMVLNPILY